MKKPDKSLTRLLAEFEKFHSESESTLNFESPDESQTYISMETLLDDLESGALALADAEDTEIAELIEAEQATCRRPHSFSNLTGKDNCGVFKFQSWNSIRNCLQPKETSTQSKNQDNLQAFLKKRLSFIEGFLKKNIRKD